MKIAMFLKRPVFEIMSFPADELEHWSCYFSISENNDKPEFKAPKLSKKEAVKYEQAAIMSLLGG